MTDYHGFKGGNILWIRTAQRIIEDLGKVSEFQEVRAALLKAAAEPIGKRGEKLVEVQVLLEKVQGQEDLKKRATGLAVALVSTNKINYLEIY